MSDQQQQPCGVCPALRAHIHVLTVANVQLNAALAHLQQLFAAVVGGVRATVVFVEKEIEQPTMPRRELIPAVVLRLTHVVDIAEGRAR
ncbi:hypothetical protein GCM10010123_44290 [Pilimelia anulata]|uniref:Uncharacterized protein n=1 Tax=Pilimelia anulata TaxID=53371 RepID=A0A8J3BBW2_9ACTN|nr:hypothetical protein [Pilimelia anulata]GGK09554.1 hypothetical protein GCM10010123_44290 [Pilimelia anulata]